MVNGVAKDLDLDEWAVEDAEEITTPNSILVYGPPGKGKTVLGASIVEVPGFKNTLVIDTEGSAVSIGPHYKGVKVRRVTTAKDFEKTIEALLDGRFKAPNGEPWDAVIIDTFDKAQERQLEAFAKSPDARTKNGEENTFYKWQAIKPWTSKVGDFLHQAPFLTIFIMHEDQDKNEQTGRVTTTVLLAGKSQLIFPSVPDMIGYFNVVKTENGPARAVDFRASDKLVSKQRFAHKLNDIVIDPTFEKIFRKIEPDRFE